MDKQCVSFLAVKLCRAYLINHFFSNNGQGNPVPTMMTIEDNLTIGFMRYALIPFLLYNIPFLVGRVEERNPTCIDYGYPVGFRPSTRPMEECRCN